MGIWVMCMYVYICICMYVCLVGGCATILGFRSEHAGSVSASLAAFSTSSAPSISYSSASSSVYPAVSTHLPMSPQASKFSAFRTMLSRCHSHPGQPHSLASPRQLSFPSTSVMPMDVSQPFSHSSFPFQQQHQNHFQNLMAMQTMQRQDTHAFNYLVGQNSSSYFAVAPSSSSS
eukprot:TRINITY_DN8450_c0_g1_i2.p1 TRINITY_DN8450_c0_g1~~TRINITY_DN8450_c0_g1_i2.p1  ORF type:complete len:175 (+),score=20.57 TRINITY_DN8450_c0_g1_i2:160-684(+)